MIVLRDKFKSTFPTTVNLSGGITLEIENPLRIVQQLSRRIRPWRERLEKSVWYSINIAGKSIGDLDLSKESEERLGIEIDDEDLPVKAYGIIFSWIIKQAREKGFREVELCTFLNETEQIKAAEKFGFKVSEKGDGYSKYVIPIRDKTKLFSKTISKKKTNV